MTAAFFKRLVIFMPIVFFVEFFLGLSCIFLPVRMFEYLPVVLGAFMLASGIVGIIHAVRTKEYRYKETNEISQAILFFASGAAILIMRHSAIGLVGVIWGIMGTNRAGHELNHAIYLISNGKKKWLPSLLLSFIGFIFSFLPLIDPAAKMEEHMVFMGIELLFMSLDTVNEIHENKIA